MDLFTHKPLQLRRLRYRISDHRKLLISGVTMMHCKLNIC